MYTFTCPALVGADPACIMQGKWQTRLVVFLFWSINPQGMGCFLWILQVEFGFGITGCGLWVSGLRMWFFRELYFLPDKCNKGRLCWHLTILGVLQIHTGLHANSGREARPSLMWKRNFSWSFLNTFPKEVLLIFPPSSWGSIVNSSGAHVEKRHLFFAQTHHLGVFSLEIYLCCWV